MSTGYVITVSLLAIVIFVVISWLRKEIARTSEKPGGGAHHRSGRGGGGGCCH